MLREKFVPQSFSGETLADTTKRYLGGTSTFLLKAATVFALILVTSFHTITLFGAPWTDEVAPFVLLAIAPAVITMALVPGQWRHPMRWLLMFAAIIVTAPAFTAVAVITIETWALYRSWVIEDGWRGFGRRVNTLFVKLRGSNEK